MTGLLRILARRHGRWAGTWIGVVGVLVAGTCSAYADTYPTAESRRVAVARAQDDAASLLLYGRLPDPGTPAQMFGWEIGTFVTLIAALLGLMLAVRVTRAAEDDGTVELVRSCGVERDAPLRAGLVLAGLVGAALGAVAGGALALQAGAVPGADARGCLAFGAVVTATYLLMAGVGCVLAQLLPTARGARMGGALVLGVAFLLRGAADVLDVPPLGWLSPLGLRGSVGLFADDDVRPLGVAAVACLALVLAATWLDRRRELGSALWSAPPRSSGRLRVRSATGLAGRLGARSALTWAAAVALGGAVFALIGTGVVESARDGSLEGGFLGAQLDGADPAVAYLAYTGTVVGIVVAASALLLAAQAVGEERAGLTEQVRSLGAAPAAPLGAWWGVAAAGSALTLVVSGVATAAVTALGIDGSLADDAFWYVVGQWPSVLVLLGVAVLLVGAAPRLAWAAWLPFGMSVALAMIGELLGVPASVIDLGAFGHLPVPGWGAGDLLAPALLAALGLGAGGLGLLVVRWRDVVTG